MRSQPQEAALYSPMVRQVFATPVSTARRTATSMRSVLPDGYSTRVPSDAADWMAARMACW